MSRFQYTGGELEINKVLKMNQDRSISLLNRQAVLDSRKEADSAIDSSIELLRSVGKEDAVTNLSSKIKKERGQRKLESPLSLESWDNMVRQANEYIPNPVALEDIMSEEEIKEVFEELDEINKEFSRKTSIINKTDLSFLAVATALHVLKSLIFPYVAEAFHYSESFDPSERKKHDHESIERTHREANDKFRDKYRQKHGTGYWINLLYQTPAYDITRGSPKIGINMGGARHRMYTLGHDPILGWLFGTMNILTDVITLNDFRSYRVVRKPHMEITNQPVLMGTMVRESYELIEEDWLNLPAAVYAQAQHLKSDMYTKVGLPVPILSSLNESFASKLYKNNYDALCFARDTKIVGASFVISRMFDMVISLVHGLFRPTEESKDLFEVRTRKILLISNSIASASTVINTSITSNPKNLDIGSLLNTVSRLFTDVRFIARIKQEFIENEIADRLKQEIHEIDRIYEELF